MAVEHGGDVTPPLAISFSKVTLCVRFNELSFFSPEIFLSLVAES